MTMDSSSLCGHQGRDKSKGLEEKVLELESEITRLRAQLSDSQMRITELSNQPSLPSVASSHSSPTSDR